MTTWQHYPLWLAVEVSIEKKPEEEIEPPIHCDLIYISIVLHSDFCFSQPNSFFLC